MIERDIEPELVVNVRHCFVAVDLKTGEFTPEMAGKMNFYLSALDNEVSKNEKSFWRFLSHFFNQRYFCPKYLM